eukprot:scaffold139431_cov27-Prasinocladus_malaysianus.AAC.1
MVRRVGRRSRAKAYAAVPPNSSSTIVVPLGAATNRGSPGFDGSFPQQVSYEVMTFSEWDAFVG